MDFRITQQHNPIQIFLGAPYKDGLANLRAAFDPKNRITSVVDGIDNATMSRRLLELSGRVVQAAVGLVLLIPGVNIVIDFALRWWSGANSIGVWQPSDKKIPYQNLDRTIINSVMPRALDFIQANGYEQAAIHYSHRSTGQFYEIRIYLGPGLGNVIVQFPTNTMFSEKELFAALKTKIIFKIKNLNEEDYFQNFHIEDPRDFGEYNQFVSFDIKPKVLRFMREIGHAPAGAQVEGGLNMSSIDNAATGSASYNLNLSVNAANRPIFKFEREVKWSSRADNIFDLRSQRLMKELIGEIALQTQFLQTAPRTVKEFSFSTIG